jgi:hypothetical protein
MRFRIAASICALTLGLSAAVAGQSASATTGRHESAAAVPAYVIQNQLEDHGKKLCITSGSVGGYIAQVDCNGSSYQKWNMTEYNNVQVFLSVAHPGYALAVTSLAAGAHFTMVKVSGAHTQALMIDTLFSRNGNLYCTYASSLVAQPQAEGVNYSNIYLRARTGLNGSQTWHLYVA